MSQLCSKTHPLAAKISVLPDAITQMERLPQDNMRIVFVPILPDPPSRTLTLRIISHSLDNRSVCERILKKTFRRRWKAAKRLVKARAFLCDHLKKEGAKLKGLSRVISPSLVSKPQSFSMPSRQLAPSLRHVVSIHSKPAEEWNPWSNPIPNPSLKHQALFNNTKKLFYAMSDLAVPREVVESEVFWDELKGKATKGGPKYYRSARQLRKFNAAAERTLMQHLISKGEWWEASRLMTQRREMDTVVYAARIRAVAAECCTEIHKFAKGVQSSAHGSRKRLKKRWHTFKGWAAASANGERGRYPGSAAGRPSPLRVSTSVNDLDDLPSDTKLDDAENDWGPANRNADDASVEW